MRKYLIGALAVLLPSALLYPTGEGFSYDWHHHVWMVGYFGEYTRQHGSPPSVVNTTRAGGLTFPVFYGYTFYPLLGLAATHLHATVVIRLAAVLLFAAQYVSVRTTLRRLNASEGLAAGAACLVVWSVYALTNLYNRSALTEFFAVGMLTCAVCSWFDLLGADSTRTVWRRAIRFGLQVTLAIGFHPITGVFSLPLLVILLCALPCRRAPLGRLVPALGAVALAAIVVLAPWVYAVKTFERELSIGASTTGLTVYKQDIDKWKTRINPLPYDSRCMGSVAPQDVSTPFLDSQIHLPLLVLALGLAATGLRNLDPRERLRAGLFLTVPLAYTMAMLYLSLVPAGYDRLPAPFMKVQFLYRVVSYVNIGCLLIPLFLLARRARRGSLALHSAPFAVSPVLLCFALTYGGFCIVLKLQHAQVGRFNEALMTGDPQWATPRESKWVKSPRDRNVLVMLPPTSIVQGAYTTPGTVAPLTATERADATHVPLGVETGERNFGDTKTATVTRAQPGYVTTEMTVFPWNRFEVDGGPVPTEALRGWCDSTMPPGTMPDGGMVAVPVPPGTHTIRCRFEPDRTWQLLHRLSQFTLAAWIITLVGLSAVRLFGARRQTKAEQPAELEVSIPLPKAA